MNVGKAVVCNPKLRSTAKHARPQIYRYYAGFSETFATTLLRSLHLREDQLIVDPWNGAGTTTTAATKSGLRSTGFDLNPAMVVVAKARNLPRTEFSSVEALAARIVREAKRSPPCPLPNDPLLAWFVPSSSQNLRALEMAVFAHLVDARHYPLASGALAAQLSCIASFFYVALFRTARALLAPFQSSNPTWLRQPQTKAARLRTVRDTILDTFLGEICSMLAAAEDAPPSQPTLHATLAVGCSSSIALPRCSADLVLTSPPYCTRIDYAVATRPELAILGCGAADFHSLRKSLIGTPTVCALAPPSDAGWGITCNRLLESIRSHPSKASGTYYYRSHLLYFQALSASIREISRVLSPKGAAVLVVQDSYYKDVHNDLPTITAELAASAGLRLARRVDFSLTRSFAGINPSVRKYRCATSAVESVLFLTAA